MYHCHVHFLCTQLMIAYILIAQLFTMFIYARPFKCYVTLEGVGGYMPKRYEALRGGGGLRNAIFFS